MEDDDPGADIQVLATQFIDGFQKAINKMAYLRLAGVPLSIDDPDGGPSLKLVDVGLTTQWQVGTASPAFGSRELSYLPFPGDRIAESKNYKFYTKSLERKREVDLRDFLRRRAAEIGD